jgi:hypothetical protein
MEIKEIKALLSMEAVLQHYGLKPDKNDRLHCPFHPDKTPACKSIRRPIHIAVSAAIARLGQATRSSLSS